MSTVLSKPLTRVVIFPYRLETVETVIFCCPFAISSNTPLWSGRPTLGSMSIYLAASLCDALNVSSLAIALLISLVFALLLFAVTFAFMRENLSSLNFEFISSLLILAISLLLKSFMIYLLIFSFLACALFLLFPLRALFPEQKLCFHQYGSGHANEHPEEECLLLSRQPLELSWPGTLPCPQLLQGPLFF